MSFAGSVSGSSAGCCSRAQLLSIVLALAAVASVSARAQSAHFNAVQNTVATTPPDGLYMPSGVAVDGSRNVYIADTQNDRVLKETLSGGSYTQSVLFSGLGKPQDVAVDSSGNVYITDTTNNQVLKETLSGGSYTQSVIAGSGLNLPQSVAVDSSGNVYIADSGNNRALKETFSGSSYTQSTLGSGLNFPSGVAVDGNGNVYIADTQNNRIVEETPAGGSYTQSVIVSSGLSQPSGVAVDGNGNVYIADSGNNRLIQETASGGTYTQSASVTGLSNPLDVAVDASGYVYIADSYNNQVLIDQVGAVNFGSLAIGSTSAVFSLTFAFDSGGTMGAPAVLTQASAGLDFADAGTGTCDTNGTSHSYAAGDTCTIDVTFTPKFTGQRQGAAELVNSSGAVIATAYLYGTGTGAQVVFAPPGGSGVASGLNLPQGVAVDGSGDVYIADTSNNRVLKETLSSGSYTQSVIAGSGLNLPQGVAVDGSGNVYIADTSNNRVLEETLSRGSYTQSVVASSGLSGPAGVAVDGSGNVYIADSGNNRVLKETLSSGSYTESVIAGSGLSGPGGVAVDGSGNVYIADKNNYRVLKETLSSGSYTQTVIAGTGLNLPQGVAVDGHGNVYIADTYNNRVLKETLSSGSYTETVFVGLGLQLPTGVSVDAAGIVYIGDSRNNRVVKENVADPPSLHFVATPVGSTSSDSPQMVTISNVGNGTLTFPVPTAAGTSNPSASTNFVLNSSVNNPCTQTTTGSTTAFTLAPGASCNVGIDFVPTTAGSLTGGVTLTDNHLNAGAPNYAVQTIQLSGSATAASITISPSSLPAGTVGAAYSQTLTASGGSAPYSFSSTNLPSWLSLSTSGVLSGTPTATGDFTFTVTATDANQATGSASYTLKINAAPDFTFSASSNQTGTLSTTAAAKFIFNIAPVNGSYPAQVSFSATGMPAGYAATFSPSSIAANAGAATVTMTLAYSSSTAQTKGPAWERGAALAMSFFLLPLLGLRRFRRQWLVRSTLLVFVLLAGIAGATSLSGCGSQGGNSSSGTGNSTGTGTTAYTITVTATSGSDQHAATVQAQVTN